MESFKRLWLLIMIFVIASCRKEYVGDYDPNYIGEWHSVQHFSSGGQSLEVYMLINGEESVYGFLCQVNCSACQCEDLMTGKAVIKKNHKKLYIGSGNGKRRAILPINVEPHLNSSGQWECTINEVVMIRN